MGRSKQPRPSRNPYKHGGTPKVDGPVPQPGKVPRIAQHEDPDTNQRKIRFVFDMVDHDGLWAPHLPEQSLIQELFERFAELEGMTWGEAQRAPDFFKTEDIGGCPNTAVQKRLMEEYQGLDSLGRFRVGGKKRLWGVRDAHEFHVIWWDPEHEVWPSKKKHT